MIKFLKKLFRRPNNYAVIYDVYDPEINDWREEFYEMFSSPEEAIRFFTEAYGPEPQNVHNPRVVIISDLVPGVWDTEREYREDAA